MTSNIYGGRLEQSIIAPTLASPQKSCQLFDNSDLREFIHSKNTFVPFFKQTPCRPKRKVFWRFILKNDEEIKISQLRDVKTSKRKVFETSFLKHSRRSKSRDLFGRDQNLKIYVHLVGSVLKRTTEGRSTEERNGPAGVTCAAVADELQYDKPTGSGSPARGRATSAGLVN